MAGINAFTKLMLHMNGSDGSTTFTDVQGHTVTPSGTAQIDTAQSQFGGASGLFDGSSACALTLADSADWDFGNGNFTIDFWYRPTNNSGTKAIVSQWAGSGSGASFYLIQAGAGIQFWYNAGAGEVNPGGSTISLTTNTWQHICVMRSGNTLYYFKDGVQSGTASFNVTIQNSALSLHVSTYNGTDQAFAGHIDELRIQKGEAYFATGGFTPETSEYSNGDQTVTPSVIDVVSSVVDPTPVIDVIVTPSNIDVVSTALDPDNIGNVVVFEPDVLELTADVQAPTLQISSTVAVSVVDVVSSVVTPNFPGLNTAANGTKILSFNPLIFVSDTSPAKVTIVDTSDPFNLTWETHILDEGINAQDCYFNETTGMIYIACASGKVIKVLYSDFGSQETIDTLDSDDLKHINGIPTDGLTFASTDSESAELYQIDERNTFLIDSDIEVLASKTFTIDSDFELIKSFSMDSSFTALSVEKFIIDTDFKCLTNVLDEIPTKLKDWHLFIDGEEIVSPDLQLNSINITRSVEEETTATFQLNRKHDKIDYDLDNQFVEISNQNVVQIYVKGKLEFQGKISDTDCQYQLQDELILVTAFGEKPTYQYNTITMSLPSIDARLGLYDILVQNPKISNPYIDPTNDTNPKKYKGIKASLGQRKEEKVQGYLVYDYLGTTATEIQNGSFNPMQNWTYFWSPSVKRITTDKQVSDKVKKVAPEQPTDRPFHSIILPSFKLPTFIINPGNSPFQTKAQYFDYIGTSLSPVSSDLWILEYCKHRRQRIYDELVTELGEYTIGEAPFKEVSPRSGIFVSKFIWEDRKDGLYSVKKPAYDFTNFVKKVADLEYQKLLNINGQILPDTSCAMNVTIDAYQYYDLHILTRLNVDNTTQPGMFKNNKGFPVSIKSLTISSGTMQVSITADNLMSSVELAVIDGQYPEEDSPEYNETEKIFFVAQKSDMRTNLPVE